MRGHHGKSLEDTEIVLASRLMVARPTVQVRVGGQTYSVKASASEEELHRLAAAVDQRLARLIPPGRPATPQAILLAAMALAHDLEEERARSSALAERSRTAMRKLLERVDEALAMGQTTDGSSNDRP